MQTIASPTSQQATSSALPPGIEADITGAPSVSLSDFGTSDDTPRGIVRRLLSEDRTLTQAQIAREAAINPGAFSSWLAEKYQGDNAKLESQVTAWLRARGERRQTRGHMPTPPAWVACPTGDAIWAALGYAQAAGAMSCVVGVPGIGKTYTALAYRAANPAVWVATMSPTTSGVVPALEEVAEAVGVRIEGGARRLEKAIIRKLRETNGLLIVDEAQHLSEAALDAIRSIHDATGVGMAYLGNDVLAARIHGARRAERTAQLSSRIGYRRNLRRPQKADVAALLDAWKVPGRAEREYLTEIGTRVGGLRSMTKLLQLAHVTASAAEQPLQRRHLEQAWATLGAQD